MDQTETFTDEELTSGIDVRNPRHRKFLMELKQERKHTGETFGQQLRRYEREGKVIPDSRSPSGARITKFSVGQQMDDLREMFVGVNIRFAHTFLGEKGIQFILRGKPILELSSQPDGSYRILQETDSGYKEIYLGDPVGAIQVINKWYQG